MPVLAYVSFFFVLAGFGPAISKLRRAWPGTGSLEIWPSPNTLLRRLASVYLMYLLGLLSSVALRNTLPLDWRFGAEVLLLQSWWCILPRGIYEYYNVPGWFVSAVAFLWLFEEVTFTAMAAVWRSGRPVVYSSLLFVLFIFASAFCKLGAHWQSRELWGCPVMYWHQYASGVALAFLVRQRALDNVPASTWYACAALLALSALVCIDRSLFFGEEWTGHMVRELGILTPLFCLLIMGLAENQDPLARLLASFPFVFAKHVAFGVYAMQVTVVYVWRRLGIIKTEDIDFVLMTCIVMPSLLLAAYLAQTLVQDPVAKAILKFLRQAPAGPTTTKPELAASV